VRAIMTLEGIALQLDPGFDIFAVSAPYAARMMLTFPDPGIRRRLTGELLTDNGELDWERLQHIINLASRDSGFRLETEGLVEPALDLLLGPEGGDLRRALVASLMEDPVLAGERVEALAPLISSDRSLKGRVILDKAVAFLLSDEGEETRKQLAAGLRASTNGHGTGSLDLSRILELASMAGKLHPDFGPSALLGSVGSYLLSEEGKPARNQIITAGAQKVVDGLAGALNRLARPTPASRPHVAPAEEERQLEAQSQPA
jgi:hypothetical protein